jgi:hypothetical protein
MLYRDIEYTYKEWKTHNGTRASSFNCNDKELLKHVDTVSFGTRTQDEMFVKIDDYLDNSERHIMLRELNDRACTEFYKNNPNTPKD